MTILPYYLCSSSTQNYRSLCYVICTPTTVFSSSDTSSIICSTTSTTAKWMLEESPLVAKKIKGRRGKSAKRQEAEKKSLALFLCRKKEKGKRQQLVHYLTIQCTRGMSNRGHGGRHHHYFCCKQL